jgi:hypothetical protein
LHQQHRKNLVLAVFRRALLVIAEKPPSDRGFAVIGRPHDQQIAGPDAAGFGRQQAAEQRDGLGRPRVADPAIGKQER